ncbi:protein BEAN1 [Pelodytes ibericus]
MSIKLTCTKIHTNQSNTFPEYLGYARSHNDPSLLVSPLVVAGIVIGLVLFLSCVTIIVGSLRKDGGVRDWRLEAEPSYDGISYAAPGGDLRSVCTGELSSSFEFGSYLDINVPYLDSPPRYDDCVRPGTSAMYLPADDPPPYSLEDPCRTHELVLSVSSDEVALTSLDNTGLLLPSNTFSSVGLQVAPPNRTWDKQNVHIPLAPMDSAKDESARNFSLPPRSV